jgi:hypothetical protein
MFVIVNLLFESRRRRKMTPHEVKIAALCNGNLILSATNKTLVFCVI